MKKEIESLIAEYGGNRNALLPVLRKIQENLGCVPEEYIGYVSEKLDIPTVEIYSVLTFYGMFKVRKEGKFAIKVCNSLSCHLKGAKRLIEVLEEELGIAPGEKTEDGMFSLEVVGCLGLCDSSPSMLINDKVFTNLDEHKVREIVRSIREKGEI